MHSPAKTLLLTILTTLALAPAAGAQSRCGEHPWCDTALSPDRRAELLLGERLGTPKQGIERRAGPGGRALAGGRCR